LAGAAHELEEAEASIADLNWESLGRFLQSGAAKTLVAMQTSNTISTTLFIMCTSCDSASLPVLFSVL
jgi:hypothetical protein